MPALRLLLVKTSSMGDVIHNLPVVTDILRHLPDAKIDWCVEESFAALPALHPGVRRVIPVAIRRWRKSPFSGVTWTEIRAARAALKETAYDMVLDTQGLLKSVLIARQAQGTHCGYAAESIREPLASRFYDQTFGIPKALHAVMRNRWLAAAALDFPPDLPLDYGITAPPLQADWLNATPGAGLPYAVCLTATSRDSKLWPEAYWIKLGQALHQRGWRVVLPGGKPTERERATRIAAAIPDARVTPPLNLTELAGLLAGSGLAIGVDTGLTHLAAALNVPTLALYVATDPGLTGVLGSGRFHNLGGKAQLPDVETVLATLPRLLPALVSGSRTS